MEEWTELQKSKTDSSFVIFTVKGYTVTDYLMREWDAYHERKMIEAKERVGARNSV